MKRLIGFTATVLLVSLAAPASAQIDMFLDIDGIPGESTDESHQNWIELRSFAWGVSNAGTGVGGGSGGSRPTFSPFSFVKGLDASVPKLFVAAASGNYIPDMTLDLVKPGAERHRFFQMVFEDVRITSLNMSANTGSATPEIAVKASYDKITLRYTPVDATGKPGADIVAQWDLKADRAFSGDPAALMGLFEAGGSIENGDITLVSAVPEPESYAMMLAGLAFVLLVARRRLPKV